MEGKAGIMQRDSFAFSYPSGMICVCKWFVLLISCEAKMIAMDYSTSVCYHINGHGMFG